MLIRISEGDVLTVPVVEGKVAVAQAVRSLRSNLLLAVYSTLWDVCNVPIVDELDFEEPIFLAETMDLRIREGIWQVIGNRYVPAGISVPEYKVWVEPPGEFRRQDVHGQLGEVLSSQEAESMRLQKSFSPAVIEAALRGLHGFGPWRSAFDELLNLNS